MNNSKEEFISYLINNNPKSKELLLNILAEKDYKTLKDIINALNRNIKKNILNKNIKENFLFLVVQNIDEQNMFDEEMTLKKEFNFLNGYEKVLVQKLLRQNYHFSKKQIENSKDNILLEILKYSDNLNQQEALNAITSRIKNKCFDIKHLEEDDIKQYLQLSSTSEDQYGIEKLINDDEFINLYASNNITLTDLLLTSKSLLISRNKILDCEKSKKAIKENPQEIANLLSGEEVKYLWQDNEIKNLFLDSQLRFDCLDIKSQKNLLENIDVFNLYPLNTIKDFIKGYEDKVSLSLNQDFVFTYLNKLKEKNLNYQEEDLFLKKFNKESITELEQDIRFTYLDSSIILYIINNIKQEYITILYKNINVKEAIFNNKIVDIYIKLPSFIANEVLNNLHDLLSNEENRHLFLNSEDEIIRKTFKQNSSLYNELLSVCQQKEESLSYKELERLIKIMPPEFYRRLTEEDIHKLYGTTIIVILADSKTTFRKVILDNPTLCSKIINSINSDNIDIINKCLLKITDREKVSLITKAPNINNPYGVVNIVKTMSDEIKRELYQNRQVRDIILFASSTDYIIDSLTSTYLLENKQEISKLSSNALIDFLNSLNLKDIKDLLKEEEVIKLILLSKDANYIINNLLSQKNLLLSSIINDNTAKYLSYDVINSVLDSLSINDKKIICSSDKILLILFNNNQNILKTYHNLLEKNKYLLNSLELKFLTEQTIKLKFSHLEYLSKQNYLQKLIININEKYLLHNKFITTLLNNDCFVNNQDLLISIFETIYQSINSIDRKKYGNFLKIFENVDFSTLSIAEINKIINYYLYVIPIFEKEDKSIKRPSIIEIPSTYNELVNYEDNFNHQVEKLLKRKTNDYKSLILLKYYKMTLDEAKYLLNRYQIDKINEVSYKYEINFLLNLKNIINQSENELRKNKKLKEYSINEIFKIEGRLKELFNKLYNYELNLSLKNLNQLTLNLYGKEIKVFEPKEKAYYLVSDINIKDCLKNNNDIPNCWNDYLSSQNNNSLITTLISNDNLGVFIANDINVGFSKLGTNSIVDIVSSNKTFFALPRTLINNSRSRNNIILDKYETNNNFISSAPYIYPDYLLVFKDLLFDEFDNLKTSYFEVIYRISVSFKTKKTPKGLPIILVDRKKIIAEELEEINKNLDEYNNNHNILLLRKIINKFSNNKIGLILSQSTMAHHFDGNKIKNSCYNWLKECNNKKELSLLKELFTEELNKYDNNPEFSELLNELPFYVFIKMIEEKIE